MNQSATVLEGVPGAVSGIPTGTGNNPVGVGSSCTQQSWRTLKPARSGLPARGLLHCGSVRPAEMLDQG